MTEKTLLRANEIMAEIELHENEKTNCEIMLSLIEEFEDEGLETFCLKANGSMDKVNIPVPSWKSLIADCELKHKSNLKKLRKEFKAL